jgi:ADP-ribosylglycohydrolase
MRWTDDTQMTLDLAESLIAKGRLDSDDVAQRFAESYRWSRGYGPAAAKLLKRIRRGMHWAEANRCVYPEGSFGNGGAMRAPVIGLFYASDTEKLIDAARLSAQITHAHPLGIEGAVLIATATAKALFTREPAEIFEFSAGHCREAEFQRRLSIARTWLTSAATPDPREVRRQLGNGIAATESCATALYLALRFVNQPFLELQSFIARCGGDADTIGAMAGAVWGAANGAAKLPDDELQRLEDADRIRRVAEELFGLAMALWELPPGQD